MSIIDDIMNERLKHLRAIGKHSKTRGLPLEFVEAALRIEYDYEAEDLVLEAMRYSGILSQIARDEIHGMTIGPMTYAGFAFYRVRKLPAPGWRIINPFEKLWKTPLGSVRDFNTESVIHRDDILAERSVKR